MPAGSVTVTPSTLVPKGRTAEKETFVPAAARVPGTESVWTAVPFKDQTTVRLSPSASETKAESEVLLPHSTVLSAAQVICGVVSVWAKAATVDKAATITRTKDFFILLVLGLFSCPRGNTWPITQGFESIKFGCGNRS